MENSIPTKWKECVTCANYCGKIRPDAFCSVVYFDSDEYGYCAVMHTNRAPRTCSCSHYIPRFNR